MRESRLYQALAHDGGLPAGRVLLRGPGAAADLTFAPLERALVAQGFRPDHDAWAAQGFSVAPEPEGDFASAVIFVPQAKALARAWLADAAGRVPPGGPIWLDGQKTDGIEALRSDIAARMPVSEPVAQDHGKAFRVASPGPAAFSDWAGQPLYPAPGFVAPPGAFSADGIDAGSALLAASLPVKLPPYVADLGAGWGWLSAQILARENIRELHLIEADHAALMAARANVTDPRARFHWADATTFKPAMSLNAIICNPPFHAGRAPDPSLGIAFIRAAVRMLDRTGDFWCVANRGLPYEKTMAECFRSHEEVARSAGFKVLHGKGPKLTGH